jgi:hypothetical protein
MLLDRTAMNNGNLIAKILRRKCKLNASRRSVQRYVKLLGCRKIKRKTCAFVSINC